MQYKKKSEADKTRSVTLMLPPDLYEEVKELSQVTEMSVSYHIREAIIEYLSK